MSSDLIRRLLPLVALGQFLAAGLNAWTGLGQSIGQRALEGGPPPELPLGPFFSIWGVIFVGFLILSVRIARYEDELARRLAPPLALAGVGNIVWMLEAQLLSFEPLSFALLFIPAAGAWTAAARFDRMRGLGGGPVKFAADLVSGLWAGWIAVAIAISVPRLARHVAGLGPSDAVWPMLVLALATAAAGAWLLAARVTRSPWPFVALGWGLLGVALNNLLRTELGLLGWAALTAAAVVLILRLTRGARGAGVVHAW